MPNEETKYAFIKQLIGLAEQFEQEHKTQDGDKLLPFTTWLSAKVFDSDDRMTGPDFSELEVHIRLGQLITFLYRYARHYTKQTLEDSPLLTFDDFTYLTTVWHHQSITKMELISEHVQEKPTGIEIIKRLLKNELLIQQDDALDKRSKRLFVTPKGIETLMSVFPGMAKVGTVVAGDLTREEKLILLHLLSKLNLFHNSIYLDNRNWQVDQILAEKLHGQTGNPLPEDKP